MILTDKWLDYELLDAGDGEKLERWGKYILRRPDPQAIWPHGTWQKPDAHYIRSNKGGGSWRNLSKLPERWTVSYPGAVAELTFGVNLSGFKHTGLFPEQGANWDFMSRLIQKASATGRKIKVLNLFAYTGGATVACSMAGAAEVVHVDASKGMIARAKENLQLSGGADNYVRFLCDDVNKFVERELRRGNRYDGIIMDPPAYGRGPSGELWKLEDSLYGLVERCTDLLSEEPLFMLVNAYATGLSPCVIESVLRLVPYKRYAGTVTCDELCLPLTAQPVVLPCGYTGRWYREDSV